MGDPQPLSWLSELISRHGVVVALPMVFFGGLALNLTPCVYPMLPVTLAFFTGQAANSRGRLIRLALCYVGGIALSYAALGAAAAQTGALFGSWLQHPAVLIWIALAVLSLALSMFGLYEIRLPSAISSRLGAAASGYWGAWIMGLLVGIVASPCVGPFLVGLMLLATQLGNPAVGFVLFLVLGIGMGAPSLALAVAAGRVSRLPKAGAWLIWVKKLLGIALIGLALYFVRPLVSAKVVGSLAAALLAGAGVYLGWLDRTQSRGAAFRTIRQVIGVVLLVGAVAVAWPRSPEASPVPWRPYTHAVLEEAQRAGRPVLVDVYADWCLPCVEMDQVTFRHPDVVQALAGVVTLRVDATREVSAEAEDLLGRYRVYGAPTVLFFDREGKERTDLRLLGFVKPDEFLERLRHIR